MRCRSCNTRLKLEETSYKGGVSREYLDLCDKCIAQSEDFPYDYGTPDYYNPLSDIPDEFHETEHFN